MIPAVKITPAEERVLYWLCKGLSNAEICRETGLSIGTVKSHLGKMQKKTKSKSRLQLVIYIYETEIIDLYRDKAAVAQLVEQRTRNA